MNKLKLIRLERGIKGIQLAKKAGITPAYLTIIEKGKSPSAQVKRRISSALNFSIRELWPKNLAR